MNGISMLFFESLVDANEYAQRYNIFSTLLDHFLRDALEIQAHTVFIKGSGFLTIVFAECNLL